MGLENKTVVSMWKRYLESIGENIDNTSKTYTSWYFCNDEKNANELANLVVEGVKRGTTSLYELYKIDNEETPKKDQYSIVIDWNGVAQCIIKNKNIYILKFKDVDDRLAYIEG